MNTEVFDRAKRVYEAATAAYWAQRDIGGIVKLEPQTPEEWDDYRAGVRFRPTNPAAAKVLGVWQKARAELQWAQDDLRRAGGDDSCRLCNQIEKPVRVDVPDRRLPPGDR